MQLQLLDPNTLENMSVDLPWKCNGCGHYMAEPSNCPCCDTPQCPKCKRTYTLMNVWEFHRAIERDDLMLPKKERNKTGTRSKNSKPKLPNKLMKELGIDKLPTT